MDNIYNKFDIPVFKSLPALINFKNNTSENLNTISIDDINKDEPFINNNNSIKELYFLIIFSFLLFLLFLFFFH